MKFPHMQKHLMCHMQTVWAQSKSNRARFQSGNKMVAFFGNTMTMTPIAHRHAEDVNLSYSTCLRSATMTISLNIFFSIRTALIDIKVTLNGDVLAQGVVNKDCQTCSQEPDEEGRIIPKGIERYGLLVAPNIVGINHQHFFSVFEWILMWMVSRTISTN